MMISDALRQRLSVLFDVCDTDGNGRLERCDVQERAQRRLDEARIAGSDERTEQITAAYLGFWEGLAAVCDLHDNGRVVRDEWLAAFQQWWMRYLFAD